jgi:N-acetylglucosaminyl-diphospho-decaprenol L-rhamnosyltransferase
MDRCDLSIVIVSYNTRDLLRACLESLPAACGTLAYEVVVVDNASADGSANMVRREFPDGRVLDGHGNVGFSRANNLGFEHCRGSFILCLNPDTVSHPGSIETLVEAMRGDPTVGYSGPKLLNDDGTHQWSAYRFHTLLSPFFSWSMLGLDGRFPNSRHCMSLHHAHGADTPIDAEWLLGAALLVRREAIEACGGFDESFFLYGEEVEWCQRLARGGWRGRYEPTATITHIRSASTSHLEDSDCFLGHDPALLVRAHRRLGRVTHGTAGMLLQQGLHAFGMSLAYLRNAWPFRDRSPAKARAARLWLAYLLHPAPNSPKARAVAALAKTPSRTTSRPSRHRRGPAPVSVPTRELAGSS